VGFSDRAAQQAAAAIVRNAVILTTLAVGLTVFFAVLAGRQIVRPLKRLREAFGKVREGDFDVRLPETTPGELGEIEVGFNTMAGAIAFSADELQQEVAQATSDLQQTMEALEIRNIQLDLARKRALDANAAKSEFLANMSHEIRTPMNGVLGFARLLRQSPGLDDDQRQQVDTIIDSATTLMSSLNDILDFSKMEAGKVTLDQRPFSLREAIGDAVRLFSAQAQHKGLDLTDDVDRNLPDALVGDAARLTQIVNNLVSNAIKFTDRGHVRVDVRLLRRDDRTVWLRLSVSDTGIGIPDDVMQTLFSPFEQGAAATTRLYGGTGLGLSICRGLAEAMGGEITGESRPGAGACFVVSLPFGVGEVPTDSTAEEAAARDRAPVADDWLDGMRFLVVDDNVINLQLIDALLSRQGAEVVRAVDGLQAVEIAAEAPFDMAFIDIHMPRLDGFGAARRIRESSPGMPLVALTADATQLERIPAAGQPFDSCLVKPIDDRALRKSIARALDLPSVLVATAPVSEPAPDWQNPVTPVRDRPRAIEQAGGAVDVADGLFAAFLETLPDSMGRIRAAAGAGDLQALWAAAHRLQGAAASCSLPRLYDALAELARASKAGDMQRVAEALERVENEAARLPDAV
jgi:two-component system sensor histidine kinase BarA